MSLCSFTKMRYMNRISEETPSPVLKTVVEVNESLEPVAKKPSGTIPKLTKPRGRKARKD